MKEKEKKVIKNRKRVVSYSVKRTSPSGLFNAYAATKYAIQRLKKKYHKKFKKWLRKFR